ncbi:TonB-dependent receptor [Pedobacter sp. SD-b]|uniref:TonB-dependent receptor n=1 Tax=Pedobacter segetis TaxID=2793069 RepID=A0ABS1BLM9_9SPHI|nr:TonB-dependent receptor [Pedobacter segetis]MBK0383646.1 TonB-dependent receptor [Pedobacter segetis]
MKITIIILLSSLIQAHAAVSFAQNITLSKKNAPLEKVLKEIKSQSGYSFLYNDDALRTSNSVTVDFSNLTLKDALDKLFLSQPLSYTIKDKTVVIMPKETPFADHLDKIFSVVKIDGKVVDENGQPLPGVGIKLKGSSIGTLSNVNGEFSITVPDGNGTLIFSFIGYATQEVPLAGKTKLQISLKPITGGLDEVVVIGYGSVKKRDLTGAVSSVKAEDLVMSSGPEIGSMLKGKVAGLTIRQNSAQPGGGFDILVRGAGSVQASNQPLYVVDGFPITDIQQPALNSRYQTGTQSPLNSFNPNDIESIEVLKDASATSIYGARAANGVILITTKKGKEGKPSVNYSNNFSFQKFNENTFDVLPLNEWMQVRNAAGQEQWDFENKVAPYGFSTRDEVIANGVQPYRNQFTQNAINNVGRGTDWLSLVTRNGSTAQHNLSISGGSKDTKYLISGNYYNQDGVVKNSGFKRYSIRTNIDQDINKYIKLGVNLTASRIDNLNSQLGGDQYENSGVIRAAIQQGPQIQAIDENGNYPLNPQLALQPNPYSLLTISDQGRVDRMLLNSYLDITPIKDLTFKLKAGLDRGVTDRKSYIPTTTVNGATENGRASISDATTDDYLLEATGNYNKTFAGEHNFSFLVGASQQKLYNRFNSAAASGFITDAFLWNNLGAGTNQIAPSSTGSDNIFVSYFSRLNYNYKSKYLFTATVRTDGASVFAKNHKYGTFPSAAIAWNVAEEPFFNKIKNTVSQLKLRFSYGQTGNASISGIDGGSGANAFAAYGAYNAYLSGSDVPTTGVSLTRLENPDLKWETTTGSNFGVDYSLFNGKVEGSLEIYNNVISDLLDNKILNSYQQINTVIANIGKTRSRGFEFSVTTRNIQKKDFQWRTMFNIARYKDNWLERAPDFKPAVYVGDKDPIRAIYSRVSDGILQIGEAPPISQPALIPGDIKIKDINGFVRDAAGNPVVDANGRFQRTGAPDGIIDDADTKLMGTSDPSFMAGMTNILGYKNFSLNFDFNGLFGRSFADPNFVTYGVVAEPVYVQGYNALRTVKNRWTPTNPSTTQPSSFYGRSPYGSGDFFVQKAWFIRLQNVSLGYNVPTKLLKGVFSNARIHADAQNLFVITPYTGVDPETDSYTAAYPYIRTFTLGLNFTF